MIKTDLHITGREQCFCHCHSLVTPGFRARQGLSRDQVLVFAHPWNVRIAEDGNPAWLQAESHFDTADSVAGALVGKPVHQIEIQGIDTGGPEGSNAIRDQIKRLLAVDGGLHGRGEVLQAEAGPGDPCKSVGLDKAVIETANIDLNGDFRVLRKRKLIA